MYLQAHWSVLALAILTPPAPVASPAPACRCAQMAIERYYENADVVLVGRAETVTLVEPADGSARLDVRFTPQFRQGRAFKGQIDGVVFSTPVGSARCGVEVTVGGTYVVFASRGDPADATRAWFDTCSGSRAYFGGARATETEPFAGLPTARIVPRLFELSDATLVPQEPPASDFHTSPACWRDARIVHQGAPPPPLRERVRIEWTTAAVPDTGGVASPNRAYRFLPGNASGDGAAPGGFVLVDVERPRLLRISALGTSPAPNAHWISEKLLFLRLVWGRVQFTDLVIDVERGVVVYEEAARYAAEAFEQYREACIGQCPCFVVPGETGNLATPPPSRPADGDTGPLAGLTGAQAFLDGDWDGRVFTVPGGLAFTVSGLKGELGRDEYPADVLEVREVAGGWWLRVALYAVSRCSDANAAPVHAGWVPAYSGSGALVAGTHPGGCAP